QGGGMRHFEEAVEQQRASGARLIWLSAGAAVLNAWAVQATFAALLIAGAWWINALLGSQAGAAELVAAMVSMLLAARYIDALLEVAGYGEILRGARAQLDAIEALLAVEPLPEPDAPQAPLDASIELRNVHFRYAQDEPYVLHGVNLRVEPGSMIALIGESGSGKTTLARLIARFFDVNGGSVLLGGVDVRKVSSGRLAGQISQIFQDNYLFTGSIADNIRVGKPDCSDAELLAAMRQAGVAEIVSRLPQGLETPVGEGGTSLSGGERQRIAIARALLSDAPILLVDEATAALDAENQAVIAETLARLRGKRTLVVIAHQLSTVAMADRIAVLEGGRIVEEGAPAALRENQGRYARFLSQRQAAKGWRIGGGDA
ncbi:ABC transporter ATP-binding protein, partial [Achromobacter sp. AGC25]